MGIKSTIILVIIAIAAAVLGAVIFSAGYSPSDNYCLGVGIENPKAKEVCGYEARKNPELCGSFDFRNPDMELAKLCGYDGCVMPAAYPDPNICYGLLVDL